MRTTLTLDPDVAQALKSRAEQKNMTLKRVVNEALRRGLSVEKQAKPATFRVTPHAFGIRPGIDIYKLGQLADELETQTFSAPPSAKKGRR